ncbi:hypothetical protein [Mycobacterium basiliense]|nr:hypothetical protein [Mycobacterium basiliense]
MTSAIVATLALLGIGIVTNELLRLRRWLKNSPAEGDDAEPPDEPT